MRADPIGRLTDVEKVDCQYLLVAAADLSEQKIGAAIEHADLGKGAAKASVFLTLQKRKENKCVRRIDIALDRLEIVENEFLIRSGMSAFSERVYR